VILNIYKDTPLSPQTDDNNSNKFYTNLNQSLDGAHVPAHIKNQQPPISKVWGSAVLTIPSPDVRII